MFRPEYTQSIIEEANQLARKMRRDSNAYYAEYRRLTEDLIRRKNELSESIDTDWHCRKSAEESAKSMYISLSNIFDQSSTSLKNYLRDKEKFLKANQEADNAIGNITLDINSKTSSVSEEIRKIDDEIKRLTGDLTYTYEKQHKEDCDTYYDLHQIIFRNCTDEEIDQINLEDYF